TRFSRDWSSDVCSSDLYCLENCCWANWYAQSINKRTSLSEDDVNLIFELRKQGFLQKEIANIVGCQQPQISAILLGKSRTGVERSEERRVGKESRTRTS